LSVKEGFNMTAHRFRAVALAGFAALTLVTASACKVGSGGNTNDPNNPGNMPSGPAGPGVGDQGNQQGAPANGVIQVPQS
jgi:hypothetical protein